MLFWRRENPNFRGNRTRAQHFEVIREIYPVGDYGQRIDFDR